MKPPSQHLPGMQRGRRRVMTAVSAGVLAIPLRSALGVDSTATVGVVLQREDVLALESIGERLVPGSTASRLSAYVDSQLSRPASACLLAIRYLDLNPPYLPIYQRILRRCNDLAQKHCRAPVWELTGPDVDDLIVSMRSGTTADWNGLPAQLMYLALRNDAVDVVYGTPEGFERLGRPYMAHIPPSRPW